jgi:hypothetical protein
MAGHPQSISVGQLQSAVAAAVKQIQQQKALTIPEIKGPFILGRWIEPPISAEQANAAAREITKQVSAQIPGLQVKPFSASHPGGGTTMGMVMSEE